MKTLSIFLTFLLLGVAIIFTSCAKDEAITPIQKDEQVMIRNNKKAVVPFKGRYITDPQFVSFEYPILTLFITAEGSATHLGKSSWEAVQIGIQAAPGSGDPQILYSELVTFTAANGDQLFGTYDGEGYGDPTSVVTFSGNMYITSGSGRFSGVKEGVLPYYGEASLTQGGFIVFHDGYLKY